MLEQHYRPPLAETQVEGSAVSTEEPAMPSIEDLYALLRESENVATVASMSEEEIDEMVRRRQRLLERLKNIDAIRESRLQRVENYNPLGDLKPSDYERLVQEEMIDPEKDAVDSQGNVLMLSAKSFRKLDELIAKLEAIEDPAAAIVSQLERLASMRNLFRERLESQIEQQKQEITARCEEVKNRVIEHYAKRAQELEKIIAEIESNPRVVERLQTMAEKEMKELFAKREKEKQEAEARIEKERKAIIQKAALYIQSLEERHGNAFKRLGELMGNEKIADELLEALGDEDQRKQQAQFDRVRSRLINAIIHGEGTKQLKDPKEIVPWAVVTSIPYGTAIDFLRLYNTGQMLSEAAEAGDMKAEKAEKLLEKRNRIINENEIIKRLVGREWVTDPKTGQKKRGPFWAAFETRKKNDAMVITAARQKEREEAEKRKAAFREQAKKIVEGGGFIVEVPVIKNVRGKRVVVGYQQVAIRLERHQSKQGNDYWRVEEILGEEKTELKVGAVSPLDMSSFPQWLREAAKRYFVRHGQDFVERLTY